MDPAAAKQRLLDKIDVLWKDVDHKTPRPQADQLRREALQACHAYHRQANPAYRQRCEREGVGESLSLEQLSVVAFPEEIYKAYSQQTLPNGEKLGAFCERNVPLILEGLNPYLTRPITMDGLQANYLPLTSLRGGLDRLRSDLLEKQGVFLLTSSGTGGGTFALIPCDRGLLETTRRANHFMFDMVTDVPGYGPLDPQRDCMIGFVPRDGSMMMSFGLGLYADLYGERAFFAVPAKVHTRELRWRKGVFTGPDGALLKLLMTPLMGVMGKRTSEKGFHNFAQALKQAEAWQVRTLVFANPWMGLNLLAHLEDLLKAEVAAGSKKAGDPLVKLAPGSVLLMAGGNKSGSDIPAEAIIQRFLAVIHGFDKVIDAYGQSESLSGAIQCSQGNYHFDPHIEFFKSGNYLGYFDPRQDYRPPCILTGDVVDGIHETPCPCGSPARYFKSVQRDSENRGSKGCAAALAEYA
jgi:hypothetical protein